MIIVFCFSLFVPISNVSASTITSRRLDEVLGEYAMSLVGAVGKANDNMKAIEKKVGKLVLERFKDRTNELNGILNGALSISDGDTGMETWDKLVDFAFPYTEEGIKITSTPEMKSAIAQVIFDMPDVFNVDAGSGYKFIGSFQRQGTITSIPFEYNYVEGVNSSTLNFKIINNTGATYYSSFSGAYLDDLLIKAFTPLSSASNVYEDYIELTEKYKTINNLRLYSVGTSKTKSFDVYYATGSVDSIEIDKSTIFNRVYLDKSSNDIFRVLNGQYGDNTTVIYKFDRTYNNFNDFGVSPDKNNVSSGDGILGTLLEFLGSIPILITEFLDSLLGLVGKIVALFIPTGEQLAELKDSFSNISLNLSSKFKPITAIGDSFSSIFSSPKSLYDLTFEFNGEEIHVLPIFLQSQISYFRLILSGGVLLTTVIEIYKRFVGREDLIK